MTKCMGIKVTQNDRTEESVRRTESARQENCSTMSGVVRLGFVGQLPVSQNDLANLKFWMF